MKLLALQEATYQSSGRTGNKQVGEMYALWDSEAEKYVIIDHTRTSSTGLKKTYSIALASLFSSHQEAEEMLRVAISNLRQRHNKGGDAYWDRWNKRQLTDRQANARNRLINKQLATLNAIRIAKISVTV